MPFEGQTRTIRGQEKIYQDGRWVDLPPTGVQGPPKELAVVNIGEVPPLNPDDFYWKWDANQAEMVPARKGEPGATFSNLWWADANEARSNIDKGFGPSGPTGPTAAELAIERSKVQAQNLATFVSGTVAELEAEISAGNLKLDQGVAEFNRRLDAFAEAGAQFQGIQPYTIPIGAKYAPGFQPGGIGERLGIAPREAVVTRIDPFGEAARIVAGTPVLTEESGPSGDALAEAIRIAEGFLGG